MNKEQKQWTLADALVNPVPEIMPEDAMEAGALVVGTGRSDFPNQVNNVLAFPGIFRGALDEQAWITGFNTYVLDPTEPFPNGFSIGDFWA